MKIKDLKSGMLVKLRNENIYVVINDTLFRPEGFMRLDVYHSFKYTEAFDSSKYTKAFDKDDNRWDIIEVSAVLEGVQIGNHESWVNQLKLNSIWEEKDIFQPGSVVSNGNGLCVMVTIGDETISNDDLLFTGVVLEDTENWIKGYYSDSWVKDSVDWILV